MKKIGLLFSMLLFAAFSFGSQKYYVNDADVDALFNQAIEISLIDIAQVGTDVQLNLTSPGTSVDAKDPIIAFVICWFVGYLGAHRWYLGTSGLTKVLYFITCGGFGIVVTIDWVMLLLAIVDDGNITKFVDNPSFIMW